MDRYTLVKGIIEKIENGVFVEIGTDTGHFSSYILEHSKNSILYCIDPFIRYNDYEDSINNMTGTELYNETYSMLKSLYGDRVKFIRKFAHEAVNDIPDTIDFLYIDGNHSFKYVYADLELYYPKVKKGCSIVGDDAIDTDDTQRNGNGDVLVIWKPGCYGHYGVIKAFREFCIKKDINGTLIGNQYQIQK